MTYEKCSRCGKHVGPGDIRYLIRMTAVGDDGGMPEEVIDPDLEIEKLLNQIENMETYELENEVLEERVFVLCGDCKQTFFKRPFGHRRDSFIDDDEYIGPIQ